MRRVRPFGAAPGKWRQPLSLLLLLALVFLLWESAALAPLRLLVVFFHEASHAVVTWATGGEVREMVVNIREGGHVVSRGGNRFLVLNAGYLGSLLWGLGISLAAAGSRFDRAVMAALGLGVAAVTLLFAGDLFTWIFGAGAALAMLLASRLLGNAVNDFLLRLLGLTSILYVPRDIYSDTIARSRSLSDARMLAGEYGGFTVLWGGAWLLLSVGLILFCLGAIAGGDEAAGPLSGASPPY